MSEFGKVYAAECHYLYRKPLTSLGYSLEGFLTNLIGICDILRETPSEAKHLSKKNDVPYLLCNRIGGRLVLHFHTNREPMRHFLSGVIEGISEYLFARKVKVTSLACKPNVLSKHRYYFKYTIVEVGCLPRKTSSALITNGGNSKTNKSSVNETHVSNRKTVHRLDLVKVDSNSNRSLVEETTDQLGESSFIKDNDNLKDNHLNESKERVNPCSVEKRLNHSSSSIDNNSNSSVTSVSSKKCEANNMSKIRHEEEVYARGLLEDSLQQLSSDVMDSKINVPNFCAAFPWHFVCDQKMRFTQMGTSMMQVQTEGKLIEFYIVDFIICAKFHVMEMY